MQKARGMAAVRIKARDFHGNGWGKETFMLKYRLPLMIGWAAILFTLVPGCNNAARNTLLDAFSSAGQTVASAFVQAFFQSVGNAGY